MATPVHVPRVNNNDDSVLIVSLDVKERDFVKRGQIVGAVETDKAVVDVQAECDGYVLKVLGQLDENARVGAVLLWLGETADEPVPEQVTSATAAVATGSLGRPTAKARAMLRELGLSAESIPAAGDRLTVADIESWLAGDRRRAPTPGPGIVEVGDPTPNVCGEYQDLSPEAHGMLTTVLWHRDQAVPGYLEIEYDPSRRGRTRYAGQNKISPARVVGVRLVRPVATPDQRGHREWAPLPVRSVNLATSRPETLYLTVIQGFAHGRCPFYTGYGKCRSRHVAQAAADNCQARPWPSAWRAGT
jgi:pyruvate/2-oxoglutarate dehydrogenase complex dihydrolipoamide acyltransferase (E2) component